MDEFKVIEIKNRYAIWECVCDCGNIRNVSAKLLLPRMEPTALPAPAEAPPFF